MRHRSSIFGLFSLAALAIFRVVRVAVAVWHDVLRWLRPSFEFAGHPDRFVPSGPALAMTGFHVERHEAHVSRRSAARKR